MRAAALLLAVVALAGCGGSKHEKPGDFVTALIQDLGAGETAKSWALLHPLHRAKIPRGRYVECESKDGFGGKVAKVDVLAVKKEPATIPGQFGERPSTAVTVGVTLDVPGSELPERFTLTAHVFDVDGKWAWIVGPVDYAAYLTGNCPSQERSSTQHS